MLKECPKEVETFNVFQLLFRIEFVERQQIFQRNFDKPRRCPMVTAVASELTRKFLLDVVWDAETTRNPASVARQRRAPAAGDQLEEYDSDLLGTYRPTQMLPGLTPEP
jgi:hypothetical protein